MKNESSKSIDRSPLRYPGGKGFFYPYFSEIMIKNGLIDTKYFEPYAGGSGVALGLLSSNIISEALINDADYHIYCFWSSVLRENEHFIEKLINTEISIKEWHKQNNIYKEPKKHSVFKVGFSTFYLNRCNRSGVLAGAGPIGGYEQKGYWRLDARFNKDSLIKRIAKLGCLKGQITIKNLDAITFLKQFLPHGRERQRSFAYLDPPYVSAGNRLYLNRYSEKDHKNLANYLINQEHLNWIVTYDDNPKIRSYYYSCQKWIFNIGYSLQTKKQGKELLIASKCLKLPNKIEQFSDRWCIVKNIKES